nr:MAG TPA: hypothetical protein [Caudoviricetes sp.]
MNFIRYTRVKYTIFGVEALAYTYSIYIKKV